MLPFLSRRLSSRGLPCLSTARSHSTAAGVLFTPALNAGVAPSSAPTGGVMVRASAVSAAALAASSTGTSSSTCSPGTLHMQQRHATTYSTLRRSRTDTKRRKSFNYLTKDRMVTKQKSAPVAVQRRRDDKYIARRNAFKQQMLRDIDEKIHFYKPFVKKFVFFPPIVGSTRTATFRGTRDVGQRMRYRILIDVLEQLKKKELRPFLIKRMGELGLDPPTAEEWRRYTDPKTGDINIGILYSTWMEQLFMAFSREVKLERQRQEVRGFVMWSVYAALNLANRTKVPPLEDWSLSQGRLTTDELFGQVRDQATVRQSLYDAREEIRHWGRDQIAASVAASTVEEQYEQLSEAWKQRASLLAELEKRHLFTIKIKQVLYDLPEVKAISVPRDNFMTRVVRDHVLANNGAYYPPCPARTASFEALSDEEKLQYSAFGYRYARQSTTGQKLFIRYAVRDYGMTLSEAARTYGRLSDLQRAAMCFPFYLPIAPRNPSSAAYRRFYREMCVRYGLMQVSGPVLGNRLFEMAMRKKWAAMPSDSRAQYDEADRIAGVFPLIPRSVAGTKAKPRHSTASASSANAFLEGEDGEEALMSSSSVDEMTAELAESQAMPDAEESELMEHEQERETRRPRTTSSSKGVQRSRKSKAKRGTSDLYVGNGGTGKVSTGPRRERKGNTAAKGESDMQVIVM